MSPVSSSQSLPDVTLDAFCALLSERAGLQVRPKDRPAVAAALQSRSQAKGADVNDYVGILREQSIGESEWRLLLPLLTNGESYFERDKGQFALLRNTILPQLVELRRAQGGERVLKLWSAGCSTGEEAYSLAMAAHSVLPTGWHAHIIGTDINVQALERARRGVYGSWSFRGVDGATRERFFQETGEGFAVRSELRAGVSFAFCNLGASDWPDAARGLQEFDLVVCRNVLIYFERSAIAGVIKRFGRALRDGGFLITGHAELHDQIVAPLQTRLFRESVVYQKAQAPQASASGSQALAQGVEDRASARVQNAWPKVISPTASVSAQPQIKPSPPSSSNKEPASLPPSGAQWCAQARNHADAGRHDEAIACCEKAIAAEPNCLEAHLLWAQIAEERGARVQAKALLRKAIYLCPSAPQGYAELGAIYAREGDQARARQMRKEALVLLGDANDEPSVELKRHLEELLAPPGAPTL